MRIEAEHLDIAVRAAYQKKKDAGIVFDTAAMATFRIALNELARKRKPTDAPVMTEEEIKAIKPSFISLISGATAKFISQSDEAKESANIQDYVFVAHDYAVAVMLDVLKCNEISSKDYLGLDGGAIGLARNLINAKSDKMKDTKTFFNEQRRIDADVLENKLSDLMQKVSDKESRPSPEDVAQLYGEYQALVQRQKNHNGFWRFFHKEENINRTELLAKMKQTLDMHLPKVVMDSAAHTPMASHSPSKIQKFIEHKYLSEPLRQHIGAQDSDPAQHMGYEQYINNPEALNEKQKVTIKDLIKVDYRPNLDNLEEETKVMQQLRSALSRGLLFKNNPIIRQLIHRNYMRLGTAEKMATSPDWEKYCAGEDENFLSENPGFEIPEDIPDEIPSASEEPKVNEEPKVDEENKENGQREPIDGNQIKADMGEQPMPIQEQLNDAQVISAPDKSSTI